MNTTANTRSTERTEVLYGQKYVMNTVLQFLSQAEKIDSCGDHKSLFHLFLKWRNTRNCYLILKPKASN